MAIGRKAYVQLSREEKLEEAYKYQLGQDLNPMQEFEQPWVRAERFIYAAAYPKPTERCGKWLVYIPLEHVEAVWSVVRDATVIGELGSAAKVATMKPNWREVYPDRKVICIFTYDSDALEDVKRVLVRLRELGITQEAWYKETRMTLAGQYSSNSKGPVSKYCASENSTEFFPTEMNSSKHD
jgi:hypothetical protein